MKSQNVFDIVAENTKLFDIDNDKTLRKEYSQYFTPTKISQYMVELIEINNKKRVVSILEPSAGTGMLVVAILVELLKYEHQSINIDIFEVDERVLPTLKKNLKLVEEIYQKKKKCLNVNIFCRNFLLEKSVSKYDIIIGNPPYKKIRKEDLEAKANIDIVFGQPNVYGLFIGKGIEHLAEGGQLVYLVPRSFFNGKYFTKIRERIRNYYAITYIHSFESRRKVINDEVLQELIIVKIEKKKSEQVFINHSLGINDIQRKNQLQLGISILWGDSNNKMRLPINQVDVDIINNVSKKNMTFSDIGCRFKTGPVVDFRMKNYISEKKEKNSCPLIWCANFGEIRIKWPIKSEKYSQFINNNPENTVLLSKGNYLLIKRFASKEESRCLKINILEKENFEFDFFGLENHVNYLSFTEDTDIYLKALYIMLKSTIYNRYFTLINGTTQINVNDLNELPILNRDELLELTKVPYNFEELSIKLCDELIKKYVD